jgi:outer membrane murein-binding lipoprotein Lpp
MTQSLSSRVKWGTAALKFAKNFPKLGVFGALAAIAYFGFTFIDNQTKHNQLMVSQVQELKIQNDQLRQANEAITADSKAIKEGVEKLNNSIIDIKNRTSKLSKQFEDAKFKELLKKNLPKAETEFNDMFNDYFQDIDKETKKYAK